MYILALFSFCFLPVTASLAANALVGDHSEINVPLNVS